MVLEEILKPERIPEDLGNAVLADFLKSARSLEDLAEAVAKHILKSEHTPGDLATVVAKHILKLELTPQDLGRVWARLDADITKSEQAYRDLEQAKEHLQSQRQTRGEPTEKFKERLVEAYERVLLAESLCQIQDEPLKSILYAMEGTAVCLSGGGIRSASFSLGILEGLARFSRRAAVPGKAEAAPGFAGLPFYRFRRGLHRQLADGLVAEKRLPPGHRPFGRRSSNLGRSRTSAHPPPARVHQLPLATLRLHPGHPDAVVDRAAQPDPELADSCAARRWRCSVCQNFSTTSPTAGPSPISDAGETWFGEVMALAVVCVMFASATAVWRMARPPYKAGSSDPQKEGSTFLELWFFAIPILLSAWLLGEASAWAYVSDALRGNQWPVLRLAMMAHGLHSHSALGHVAGSPTRALAKRWQEAADCLSQA